MNDVEPILFLIVSLFGLLLIILWTLLPFAVFGVKKRLDEIIYQNEITNNQLSKINSRMSKFIKNYTSSEIEVSDDSIEITCDNCGYNNLIENDNCENCGVELRKEPSV